MTYNPHQPRSASGQFAEVDRADPGQLSDDELFSLAARYGQWAQSKVAASAGHSTHVYADADDFTQDIALGFLTQRTSLSGPVSASGAVHTFRNERGYVGAIARSLAFSAATGLERSEDRKASAMFRDQRLTMESELGRSLTDGESADLADRIRLSFPLSRRPRVGFHRDRPGVVRLDAGGSDPAWQQALDGELARSQRRHGGHFVPGSVGDELAGRVEAGAPAGELKASAWDVVRGDAPPIRARETSARAATSARTVVRRGGGALAVARRHLAGLADPAETQALFAPFIQPGRASTDEATARQRLRQARLDADAAADCVVRAREKVAALREQLAVTTEEGRRADIRRSGARAARDLSAARLRRASADDAERSATAAVELASRRARAEAVADDAARDAVAGALIAHPEYADALWTAALSASTKERS